jgi:hypothetical protein
MHDERAKELGPLSWLSFHSREKLVTMVTRKHHLDLWKNYVDSHSTMTLSFQMAYSLTSKRTIVEEVETNIHCPFPYTKYFFFFLISSCNEDSRLISGTWDIWILNKTKEYDERACKQDAAYNRTELVSLVYGHLVHFLPFGFRLMHFYRRTPTQGLFTVSIASPGTSQIWSVVGGERTALETNWHIPRKSMNIPLFICPLAPH